MFKKGRHREATSETRGDGYPTGYKNSAPLFDDNQEDYTRGANPAAKGATGPKRATKLF